MYGSLYGNGDTLRTVIECDHYETKKNREVPYLASSVIYNEETEEVLIYAVNRSLDEAMELDVSLEGFESVKPLEHTELYSDDLKAVNDKETERVSARSVAVEENAPVMLKKHSWNMLRYKVGK